MERDEIEDWIDESGRIVLIGEGAHPWVVRGLRRACIIRAEFMPVPSIARPDTWAVNVSRRRRRVWKAVQPPVILGTNPDLPFCLRADTDGENTGCAGTG